MKDFHIIVYHGYWPEIFFFSCVSSRFWYQDNVGLINELRIPSFCITEIVSEGIVPAPLCMSDKIQL